MCWQDEKIRRLIDVRRIESGTFPAGDIVIVLPPNDRRIALFVTANCDIAISSEGMTIWRNNRIVIPYWNGAAVLEYKTPRGSAEITIDNVGKRMLGPLTVTLSNGGFNPYDLWERLYIGDENP